MEQAINLGNINEGDRIRLELMPDGSVQVKHVIPVTNGKDQLHRGIISPYADLYGANLMTNMGMPNVHREKIAAIISKHRTPERLALYEELLLKSKQAFML